MLRPSLGAEAQKCFYTARKTDCLLALMWNLQTWHIGRVGLAVVTTICTALYPLPLYKLCKSTKLIRSYTYCSLDKPVDPQVQKRRLHGELVQERGI